MSISASLSYFAFQLLVPFLFTLSMVAFMWGAFLYFIAGSHDEEMKERGKTVMLYGLLSFIVMGLVFAILKFISELAF